MQSAWVIFAVPGTTCFIGFEIVHLFAVRINLTFT